MNRAFSTVTLRDLAQAAGVSMMTASRAVRGVDGVSEATRQRILALATQLDYVPNSVAQALTTARSRMIGISLPTLFNEVFADVLLGMRRTFAQAGYTCIVDTSDYSNEREASWVDRILRWRPAALILTGTTHGDGLRHRLRDEHVSTMEIWDVVDDPIDLCVGIDHYRCGKDLGAFALSRGYRRMCFVGVPEGRDRRADLRVQGVADALHQGLARPLRRYAAHTDSDFLAGALGTELVDFSDPPDLIFYLNDHLAFGGIQALARRGLSVPEDIGVIGFNGLGLNKVLVKPITTMVTPRRDMGLIAAQALLARFNGVVVPRVTTLPCQMLPGATTRS